MADSKLSLQIALDHERFSRGLDLVAKRTARAGRIMTDIGKKMSIGISLPLALIGRRVVETATEFEYQMARVAAISGSAAGELGRLTAKAEELGSKTIFTAREVGQLQEEFAKLGFSAGEINQVTESTLSLAQVTSATLPRAAEIAGATLRTFGLEATKIEQVNDVVAVAISRSALDFESFAETMKYAGSQAAVSGISLEQLSAAMGVLANTGVKGSIAGTRLRMIFAKLAQEGGDVEKEFLKVIDGTMTMTEAIDRFGIRAATAIPVLQENRAEFHNLFKLLTNSGGTLDVMQEKMDDTSFAVQRKLTSALENLSIQIGKALLPMLNALLDILITITNGFAKLPTFLQGAIVVLGLLAAAMGPVLIISGAVATAWSQLTIAAPALAAALNTYALPAILAIAAVAGVVSFLAGLETGMKKVETQAERLARANETAASSVAKQTAPIKTLIAAYKNENYTLEERQGILKKLNELAPEYFNNLNAESTSVDDLTKAYKDFAAQIMVVAKARAIQGEVTRLEQERIQAILNQTKAQQKLEAFGPESADEAVLSLGGGGTASAAGQDNPFDIARAKLQDDIDEFQDVIDNIESQQSDLEALLASDTYRDVLGQLFGSGDGGGGGMGTPGPMNFIQEMERDLARLERFTFLTQGIGGQDTITFQADKLKILSKAVKEFSEIDDPEVRAKFADDIARIQEQIASLEPEVNTLKDQKTAFDEYTNALVRFGEGQDSIDLKSGLGLFADEGELLAAQINNQIQLVNFLADALGLENQMYQDQATILADLIAKKKEFNDTQRDTAEDAEVEKDALRAIGDISYGIGQNLGEAADASKTFGQAAMEAFKDAAKAAARYAYMRYLAAVMEDESKPEAISKLVAASVGLGVLTGLVNSIPALAEGGITNGPMLAMIGDNRSGKEAVIPLEKLPSLMSKMGGNKEMELSTRLDGQDLVLATRQAKYNMFRTGR